jgi:hypothetical protein
LLRLVSDIINFYWQVCVCINFKTINFIRLQFLSHFRKSVSLFSVLTKHLNIYTYVIILAQSLCKSKSCKSTHIYSLNCISAHGVS